MFSLIFIIYHVDSDPAITLDELIEHLGLERKLLDQRCQDNHLQEIASLLVQCDACDLPLLRLSKTDFNTSPSETKMLHSLQSWKKRCGFKAKYKCLVEEFLACGNAELAEEVCSIVSSKHAEDY